MSAALTLSAARGAVLEALDALDFGKDRRASRHLVRAEVMLSAHLPTLGPARDAVVGAMASLGVDPRTARVDLERAARVLAELASEFTPVMPNVSRKASGTFAAVHVELAKGKP